MSYKNIAVPTRTSNRGRAAQPRPGATDTSYLPATSVTVPAQAVRPGKTHRFTVGQRLAMAAGGRDISRGGSACSVVALLPHEGGALKYRVRSDNETFERIVDETDLSPLASGLD